MIDDLRNLYNQADAIDRREGKLAYKRYNELLQEIAARYGMRFSRVVAAFVAMSPNSDYEGNLRSLVSLLEGVKYNKPLEEVTVSTYRHCLVRAHMYIRGHADFLDHAKGRKIRAFYSNILSPEYSPHVTVDGHIYAAWVNRPDMKMKDVALKPSVYDQIQRDVQEIAAEEELVPNQVQATIWFVRKRTLRIRYDDQLSLLTGKDNHWRTLIAVDDIRPYPRTA